MNTTAITVAAKKGVDILAKHSPEVLAAVASGGTVVSIILAIKATPKALILIEEAKAEKPLEKIQACWKVYIPTALMGAVTIASIIGGTKISLGRNAALAGLCSVMQKNLIEHEEKVKNLLGDKKSKELEADICKDKIKNSYVLDEASTGLIPGKGDILCYDAVFGQYFKGNMDIIRRAAADLKVDLMTQMYCSLNEFYDKLGIPKIDIGDELGWSSEDDFEVNTFTVLTPDDKPCLAFGYETYPKYRYDKTY